ncbi:response regulator transcription factor [Sulfuricurvum sp.]|uniref:response regulator transcription factor n=1 Tax=Sulfuricurvum sp. TaxID=2025608 RepID=UPI003C6150BD
MPFKKKVLIVDDDPSTRMLSRQVLQKLDFVDFLEAENGEEAIQIARDEQPDLILMDVVMPGIDGYEACRRIKQDSMRQQSTIIIFLTAVRTEEMEDKIIQAQGNDLLHKPLDASELYFRVKNYLTLMAPEEKERARDFSADEPSAVCADKEGIDLGEGFYYEAHSKRLVKAKQYIPLMQQEILLLEAFIKHQHHVLSYEQLLQIIGKNGDSTIANLRTLIKLLRRKTYRELIRTLPSVGYQCVVRRL